MNMRRNEKYANFRQDKITYCICQIFFGHVFGKIYQKKG
jgi:hypothetical protein